MATIYQKTVTDKTAILSPREYFMRPFDFQNWTEMRWGMYFGGVASSGDNTASSAETLAQSSVSDKIAVGIKNSDTNDLPGVAGSLFIGAGSFDNIADCSGSSFYSNNGGSELSATAYAGVTMIGGSTSNLGKMDYPTVTGASTYCGFWAIKYVITDLGLSTQSVNVAVAKTASVSGTDYSASALRTLINNGTYGSGVNLAWNTGAAARAIPDAVFIRLPFYSNRIRISCIRAIRYAP